MREEKKRENRLKDSEKEKYRERDSIIKKHITDGNTRQPNTVD